jgi:hypothetical protein
MSPMGLQINAGFPCFCAQRPGGTTCLAVLQSFTIVAESRNTMTTAYSIGSFAVFYVVLLADFHTDDGELFFLICRIFSTRTTLADEDPPLVSGTPDPSVRRRGLQFSSLVELPRSDPCGQGAHQSLALHTLFKFAKTGAWEQVQLQFQRSRSCLCLPFTFSQTLVNVTVPVVCLCHTWQIFENFICSAVRIHMLWDRCA